MNGLRITRQLKMLTKLKNIAKNTLRPKSLLWKSADDTYQYVKRHWLKWTPNKNRVEIEITTRCTLSCFNCDRSIRHAPEAESMSLFQIDKFINESLKENWRWEQITLLGGEPLLHPKIFDVLDMFKRYLNHNKGCSLKIITNGYGNYVKEIITKLPSWVDLRNTSKTSDVNEFDSYNIAPADLAIYSNADFSKGCHITERCGLGLTRYGYYPCGAGAAVDRIFGFNIGIKDLPSLTSLKLSEQMEVLCRYCGHYKRNLKAETITEEIMSQCWKTAYEQYRGKRPKLDSY